MATKKPGHESGGGAHVGEASPIWIAGTISAGAFKARCLQLMDEVNERRVALVITKRGRPVARLVPVDEVAPESFGILRGTVRIRGDIVAPDPDAWAERDAE